MSDNLKKKGKQDDIRISFKERYEVAYWAGKFKVSTQQLHAAHKVTGSVMVKNIQKYLEEKGKIPSQTPYQQ